MYKFCHKLAPILFYSIRYLYWFNDEKETICDECFFLNSSYDVNQIYTNSVNPSRVFLPILGTVMYSLAWCSQTEIKATLVIP